MALRGARASGMNVWVPVADESAVVTDCGPTAGARRGFQVPAVVRARVRISVAGLEPAGAAQLASDFAAVLGESEAACGG
ncbi:hypothetical protein ACJ6WE_05640 [Streptomyces sp. MMS24-I31]|uniref:hypothetical protein n=1 Tax=Streptomyces sp. MMS24-I31 TaxID=3351563 RepID=UPI0038968BAD